MPPQIQKITLGLIDQNLNNPRKVFDPNGQEELTISLRQGQRVPCIVFAMGSRYMLVDGERRWRAAQKANLPELLCVVLEKPPTRGELLLTQLAIDGHNSHLSAIERANLYAETLRENGMTATQLHEREGISQATISKYLSIFKCVPDVQTALAKGLIGVTDCQVMAPLPAEEQLRLLDLKLSGASRDEIASICRQKRKGGKPAAKVSRLKVVLVSGVQILMTGREALGLESYIDHLTEALREAKRARDQGMDAKVFAAAMKSKRTATEKEALHV